MIGVEKVRSLVLAGLSGGSGKSVVSVGLIAAPVLWWMAQLGWISFHGHFQMGTGSMDPALASPFLFAGGILLLFTSLHVMRAIGQWHGRFAKHVLVESGQD